MLSRFASLFHAQKGSKRAKMASLNILCIVFIVNALRIFLKKGVFWSNHGRKWVFSRGYCLDYQAFRIFLYGIM
jgi:hypothetical protein